MTLSRRKFIARGAAATAALALGQAVGGHKARAADNSLQPVADTAALMPRHGTVSTRPAGGWEEALVSGNGIMGAMLYGDPRQDTLVANHCKLWLPVGNPELLPSQAPDLTQLRQVIGPNQDYGKGFNWFCDQAQGAGWSGHLIWTDAYHLGFILGLSQPQDGPITDYARVEDFSTGEVRAQWTTPDGAFARRMFVSRPDNVIVVTTTGPRGKVSLGVTMQPVDSDMIRAEITHAAGLITCHNTYVKGKGGYDGVVRVIVEGGSQASDGRSVSVADADSVTLVMRLLPWRTPLPASLSQSWITSPENPEFSSPKTPDHRTAVQVAGREYDPAWMVGTQHDLASLPAHHAALLRPHAAAWDAIYGRVSLDLGGTPAERGLSSEALLDLAQKEQRLPAALLERMYDAGRYVYLCSAGPETPPNLYGIWTGTWHPEWSGDYTTDTNLQLDVESAYSGNMAEAMMGFFHLWDSFLPDFQRNARQLYGCRGIATGMRQSNNGLALHWGSGWPGFMWTVGQSWIAHFYYDHYQYTGDKTFLRDRALPFMEQCALFWEDFLHGTEDANGRYTFRPSYSAENGWGDNAAQDIEIVHELLTNLCAGCEALGVKARDVVRWKALRTKLPPLLINSDGQLKEWSDPTHGENNDHRHMMHLYGAFQCRQFSAEADPVLFAAARVALLNRIKYSTGQASSTHGRMHIGLSGTELGLGDVAYQRLQMMATGRSMYPSLVCSHEPGPGIFCDDGNGAMPEIVNRMFVQSTLGRLMLLPAVPSALPQGRLSGVRARGQITVNHLAWDMHAGAVTATFTSHVAQTIALVLPPGATVTGLTVDGTPHPVSAQGVEKQGCHLEMASGKPVMVHARFTV